MQKLGVGHRHKGIISSAHDLGGRLDARQLLRQLRQIGRIGADEAGRLHEPVACVGFQVVVSHVRGRSATRYGVVDRPEDVLGVDLAQPLHVGRLDHVLQVSADLQRDSHRTATDRQAAHERGIIRGRPQGGGRTNIRGDEMHRPQVPLLDQLQKEGPHRVRRQQVELTLRLTKTWKVDRDEVEPLGQAVPYLSEGEHTLRPRARQDDGFAPAFAQPRRTGSSRCLLL